MSEERATWYAAGTADRNYQLYMEQYWSRLANEAAERQRYINSWLVLPENGDGDAQQEAHRRREIVEEWWRTSCILETGTLGYYEFCVRVYRERATWFQEGSYERNNELRLMEQFAARVEEMTAALRAQMEQASAGRTLVRGYNIRLLPYAISYRIKQMAAEARLNLYPKREGNQYVEKERGCASSILQGCGGYGGGDISECMSYLCVVFSEARAVALLEAILNYDDVGLEEENTEPVGEASAADEEPAPQDEPEPISQEEADRQYAQQVQDELDAEEALRRVVQEESDRRYAAGVRDNSEEHVDEPEQVDEPESEPADVRIALQQSFMEAADPANIRLRTALSDEEVQALVTEWALLSPQCPNDPKREGEGYTDQEMNKVALFLQGKHLSDEAMRVVLSEIFTAERARAILEGILGGE